ncbi:MAG TPA: 4Fe-4S dicluster domain-containing protein [Anaerolineales bacterium]|nr:4Fe-4S dicluster domain-containing protein [Anaerolineales bacterium]
MEHIAYRQLTDTLNALPNGFPPTDDGRELKLLAKLFTPEEAGLAAQLLPSLETVEEIAARTGMNAEVLRNQLKGMSKRGLIEAGRKDGALGFKLLPFVVGIYEAQVGAMDAELARLFEDYFQGGFGKMLSAQPQVHRVIPVNETIRNPLEIRPFESAVEIVNAMQSWGVQDCICRKQTALIGKGCDHPIEMCMVFHPRPNAFENHPVIRALTRDEAMSTLRHAAEAGLVHSVSNNQEGVYYICNCCTCSCGILRGMAELGIANVVASSAFVNQVDEILCSGCENCIQSCQFDALSMDGPLAIVNTVRCTGCGVCVITCSAGALGLVRRPEEEVKPVPQTYADWGAQRSAERGL